MISAFGVDHGDEVSKVKVPDYESARALRAAQQAKRNREAKISRAKTKVLGPKAFGIARTGSLKSLR